jgi:hypothetical protein
MNYINYIKSLNVGIYEFTIPQKKCASQRNSRNAFLNHLGSWDEGSEPWRRWDSWCHPLFEIGTYKGIAIFFRWHSQP